MPQLTTGVIEPARRISDCRSSYLVCFISIHCCFRFRADHRRRTRVTRHAYSGCTPRTLTFSDNSPYTRVEQRHEPQSTTFTRFRRLTSEIVLKLETLCLPSQVLTNAVLAQVYGMYIRHMHVAFITYTLYSSVYPYGPNGFVGQSAMIEHN